MDGPLKAIYIIISIFCVYSNPTSVYGWKSKIRVVPAISELKQSGPPITWNGMSLSTYVNGDLVQTYVCSQMLFVASDFVKLVVANENQSMEF